MEELYKESPELQVDLNSTPTSISNKLENGVAQLITAEAWNINPSGLMKKALSPLVTVPAAPVLSPSTDSQSGVALKMAATVLQPICLGESPVVLPIHWQVAGGTPPQVGTSNSSPPYVITTQGPVPLPVLLEQHVFQHLNSPLVLPQGSPYLGTTIQNHLFPGTAATVGQPQILDEKTSSTMQDTVLPPVFQTPGFSAVLQDFFPSPNNLGTPSPCHISSDYASTNVHTIPPQAFSSPLSPLVPPATLLVPYPVIVPLPVPIPLPIPIPIPVPQTECTENADHQKTTVEIPKSCKSTQTPMEKEDIKPFESTGKPELAQFHRHSVIKMNNENEALDLSLKTETPVTNNDVSSMNNQVVEEEGVLDLSLPVYKRCVNTSAQNGTSVLCGQISDSSSPSVGKNFPTTTTLNPTLVHHELAPKDTRVICANSSELIRQQKWSSEQSNRGSYEPKTTTNNIELVSGSQTAKVIVSVKDAVPAIFCGKIKGLSGVSTKNFSFKRDLPQDSSVQGYDVKTQAEVKENADALRKPVKNRSVKLKKVNSQEIHILPIKKQRLAAFFPRK
ncbi:PREDICTED: retinoic acid-induced protein 2 [Nanorana parkeri]|uniref:retinoic acid-induced protein 2 n=1 Tax=Nanorana parkeri TaxID=125878 RepID=UPI0008550837|nr:PREDICTED: retinoic acid-induced protein 2 [Nanorana parkeri]